MLEVQKYLKSGKTFEDLEKEFAISANFDGNKERAILNYCQLDSPKHNPIVKECRGLVIDPANS